MAAFGFILLSLSALSTMPIWMSHSVPGLQQDWAWPITRSFAVNMLSPYIGQWNWNGLGGANPTPLATYCVGLQALMAFCFGPSLGLACYLIIAELAAFSGMFALLRKLGLRSKFGLGSAAILYAFSPVFFERVQAGHLTYIFAYALCPWLGFAASRLRSNSAQTIALTAGLYALVASQVQFLFYGAVLVLLSVSLTIKGKRPWLSATTALAVGAILQLQGILPLVFSADGVNFAKQRANLAWELNLSAHPLHAAIGAGYFPGYYEHHALPAASQYALVLAVSCAALVLLYDSRRLWFALSFWAIGFSLSSGLYGPLSTPLAALFQHSVYMSIFRDLQYAAVFTTLGIATVAAAAAEYSLVGRIVALLLCTILIEPAVMGLGLQNIMLPHNVSTRSVKVFQIAKRHGDGRILWLPSEQPVRLHGRMSGGLDYALYGIQGVPSATQYRDQPALAHAVDTVRLGVANPVDFARLGIRYIVVRDDLISGRAGSLGTHEQFAFRGLSDSKLANAFIGQSGFLRIGRVGPDDIFEVIGDTAVWTDKNTVDGVLLFSELPKTLSARLPKHAHTLSFRLSAQTADPGKTWVNSFVAPWRTPWLSDAMYPLIWTQSALPKTIALDRGVGCIITARSNRPKLLNQPRLWRTHTVKQARFWMKPAEIAAVSGYQGAPCVKRPSVRRYIVLRAQYDDAWVRWANNRLERPQLIDGWAMGWPSVEAGRFIYLPSMYQALAVLISIILALLFFLYQNRRRV